MADRSRDWLAQAEQKLQSAASLAQAGHHEWVCFVSHQAAAKAVKAVKAVRLARQVVDHARSQVP